MRKSMLTYGYTHIGRQFISDFQIDFVEIANILGWEYQIGTLVVSLRVGKAPSVLSFGNRPEPKEMRRMVREAKKQ